VKVTCVNQTPSILRCSSCQTRRSTAPSLGMSVHCFARIETLLPSYGRYTLRMHCRSPLLDSNCNFTPRFLFIWQIDGIANCRHCDFDVVVPAESYIERQPYKLIAVRERSTANFWPLHSSKRYNANHYAQQKYSAVVDASNWGHYPWTDDSSSSHPIRPTTAPNDR
jgi:hypothetical protein